MTQKNEFQNMQINEIKKDRVKEMKFLACLWDKVIVCYDPQSGIISAID